MPEKRTLKRARKDKREGKSASTQAGEFVHEEIEHIREGKHGARSTKQAIAIGLSKARRAGVDLPPPKKGEASEETRRKAARDVEAGTKRTRKTTSTKAVSKKAASRKSAAKKAPAKKSGARTGKAAATRRTPSTTRSRAVTKALKREGRSAASRSALSKQAKTAARKRTASDRSAAAKKAARTRARHDGARMKHNGAAAHP